MNSLNVYTKAQKPIDSYVFGDVLHDINLCSIDLIVFQCEKLNKSISHRVDNSNKTTYFSLYFHFVFH